MAHAEAAALRSQLAATKQAATADAAAVETRLAAKEAEVCGWGGAFGCLILARCEVHSMYSHAPVMDSSGAVALNPLRVTAVLLQQMCHSIEHRARTGTDFRGVLLHVSMRAAPDDCVLLLCCMCLRVLVCARAAVSNPGGAAGVACRGR